MEPQKEPTRRSRMIQALKSALSYRTKPGCPGCLTPIMDEKAKPIVPHCSQEKKD